MSVEDKNLVLVAFADDEQAHEFKAYLDEHGIQTADEESANYLWEERFLPMSIKHLGPSLLATEVILPLDQVAPYYRKDQRMGQASRRDLLPIFPSHQPGAGALSCHDHLRSSESHLLCRPSARPDDGQARRSVLSGKALWSGNMEHPFPARPLSEGGAESNWFDIRKKWTRMESSIRESSLAFQEDWGLFRKYFFIRTSLTSNCSPSQWLLFKLFSIIPEKTLRQRIPVVPQGLEEISNDILSCAQCGNCVARCPVYRATGDETFTARGKLLTMKRALETKKTRAVEGLAPLLLSSLRPLRRRMSGQPETSPAFRTIWRNIYPRPSISRFSK